MTTWHRMDAARRWTPVCAVAAAAVAIPGGPAHAAFILEPGTYQLGDHPDANQAPPGYGLRLDGLIGGDTDDVFTFSFDHLEADMRLDITEVGADEFRLHIYGTAYGGLIDGDQYDPALSGVADIDFVYMIAHCDGADDDFIVTTPNFTNTGTIIFDGMTIDLFDRANAEGYTFQLGDEGGEGHRGFDGVSGWGWLDHGEAGTHIYSSDWLFTVVPTPGSAVLMSIAIAIFARRRRR